MALNISLLWAPWPIFFLALIVVVGLIIALTVVERRIHKRVVLKKQTEETYYQWKLGAIKTLTKEKDILGSLDDVAKEFFEEKFRTPPVQVTNVANLASNSTSEDLHIDRTKSYSDLIEFFKVKNDTKSIAFCKGMVEALYSGESLNKKKLDALYTLLEEIIGQKALVAAPQALAPQPFVKQELKAPIKNTPSAPTPLMQVKEPVLDANSAEKIKRVLAGRKPLEPLKSKIDSNREKVEARTEVEVFDAHNETDLMVLAKPELKAPVKIVVQPLQKPIEKTGFFARLFGKKKDTASVVKQITQAVSTPQPTLDTKKVVPLRVETKPLEAPTQKKVNMDLVTYIEEGLKRGFGVELLKSKLTGAGFPKNDVEAAANFISEKKAMKMSPAIKNNLVEEKKEENTKPMVSGLPKNINVSEEQPEKPKQNPPLLQKFFRPKATDLTQIKNEVEKDYAVYQARDLVVPKKIETSQAKKPGKDYANIGSMDNLERVKKKIEEKQSALAKQGYKGAELAKID